jgi:poly-gamma-glutamate synthase PgsB/CapB
MNGTALILGTTVFLIILGFIEFLNHRRNLARIPIRIHVNGTRGKSSVTRLIAAGLRQGGIRTCAKTTGTLARMILPDGTEYPVYRPVKPNINEQIRIVNFAAKCNAQALVIECMALQPYLQSISEQKLIKSTHGVITNARADHLDVMGPSENDVALALAGMTPYGGTLFTAEQRYLDVFKMSAQDRSCKLKFLTRDEIEKVTPAELAGFSYVEHAENVALALKVCESLGVSRQAALKGMWAAEPDPGVMTVHRIDFFGRKVIFVNGFAANDPESTEHIWNMALEQFPNVGKRIAIFNCREDRADRSWHLGRACVNWKPADHYVLMGTGTYVFAKAASQKGLSPMKIAFAEDRRIEEIFEIILSHVDDSALVMGMGNIGGRGLDLVQFFRNRSKMASEGK